MSPTYDSLLLAITNRKTKHVHKILENLSQKDTACLLLEKNSLLDVAASNSQSEVMALLIEKGVTKWLGSEENNRVFIRLIEDYQADNIIDKEPTNRRHKRRMNVLKHQNDSEKTTNAIVHLLERQKKWLVVQLRQTALVRSTTKMVSHDTSWYILNGALVAYEAVTGHKLERQTEIVGCNISWYLSDGVSAAYDTITGRGLRMDQTLFKKTVKLLLRSESEPDGRNVEMKGTTREVLQMIYREHKPLFGELGGHLYFEGLREINRGQYVLDLGS